MDLHCVPGHGRAELTEGRIVLLPLKGAMPGRAAGRIYRSLDDYERIVGDGYAFPGNVGFLVGLPRRQSFSPDAAFWVGTLPPDGRFLEGAPLFAVEVRSSNDYGSEADLPDRRQEDRLLRRRHPGGLGCGRAEGPRDPGLSRFPSSPAGHLQARPACRC
ncbi:MAG TPA: Uma2 family endonuclease [Thermoanaerobaculia bacterium]